MQKEQVYDMEEILRALRLMVGPQQVVELRGLKLRYGTASEYFSEPNKMAHAAAGISGKGMGVYITLNPVAAATMACSSNRITTAAPIGSTTSDKDIVSRHWLPIDFDPTRPSDVSATEQERLAALQRGQECRAYLTELGWPNPISADSGNGAHLLYAIELPNDDASTKLVRNCLRALSLRFTDSVVKLDPQNYNAGRLWKLYGTMAAKGANTPERPHRLSRILGVPDSLVPVPVPLLHELGAQSPINPKNPENPAFGRRGGRRINVGEWLKEHDVPFAFDAPWEGHHKWVMQCPWNSDHTNQSGFVVQFSDGGVMARCLHDSCAGMGWPELRDLYEPGWRETERLQTNRSPYQSTSQGLVWLKQTSSDTVHVPLTNFDARIVQEMTLDDGTETARSFQIEATVANRSFTITVPSAQFNLMTWVTEKLGAKAIVFPGPHLRDHARAAIQCLSEDIPEERIYTHTGWTKHDGEPMYLHGNGALCQRGNLDNIRTQLPSCLEPFQLLLPRNAEEGVAAVQASLKFLDLAPDCITFPLYAALWRSAIAACDFGVFLAGATGIGKSELAALLQQHFGAGFTARKLPSAWTSTSNSNEALAFTAKDALLVVDDFVLTGGQNDIARSHKEADRLLRAQGNNAGRGRMRADATLRPAKPPRGLILSTGEDLPRGSSLQARLWIVELQKDHINWAKLTECQRDAAAGLYSQAMAAFLVRLSTRYDNVQEELRTQVREYRNKVVTQTQHKRTPDIVANLAFGFKQFVDMASAIRAITKEQATELEARAWQAFGEAATAQGNHQVSQDPVQRFFNLLHAAIVTDKAYLADDGYQPQNERRERIGWLAEECGDKYEMLEPESAFRVANEMAQRQGEALSITANTLWKRLCERGLLACKDGDRNQYSWRRKGSRVRVICLPAGTIENGGNIDAPSPDNNRDFRDETDFPFGFNQIERPDLIH